MIASQNSYLNGSTDGSSRSDPEVFAIGRRRQFSGSEKLALLAEADRRKAEGTLGGVHAREAHLLLDALDLAQAARRGRSRGGP